MLVWQMLLDVIAKRVIAACGMKPWAGGAKQESARVFGLARMRGSWILCMFRNPHLVSLYCTGAGHMLMRCIASLSSRIKAVRLCACAFSDQFALLRFRS